MSNSQVKVQVYGTDICSYCAAARRLLHNKGVQFEDLRVDVSPMLLEEMRDKSNGGQTVPQIFINDRHIGGYDDMSELDQTGKLDELLGIDSA